MILGAGFIGLRLKEALNCSLSTEKIYSLHDTERLMNKFNPKIIINCIGHTGINVDDCERNLDKTLMANTFVPIILAEIALRRRIKLIHISSGCIYKYNYAKDKPITENKTPDFFDLFYSRSKIYTERALEVLANKFNVLIIRIRIPLDSRPHPRNILTKIIKYQQIIDLPNSVTYVPDFIKALKHLIKINAKGIYNIVNKGSLRYHKLAAIFKKHVPSFEYKVIPFKKLNLVRTNLVLSCKKLEKTGFKMRNIEEVLEECVKDYLKY